MRLVFVVSLVVIFVLFIVLLWIAFSIALGVDPLTLVHEQKWQKNES